MTADGGTVPRTAAPAEPVTDMMTGTLAVPAVEALAPVESGVGEKVADVVEAVRDGIVKGRFAPGQRLPEAELVTLFGASRGAVRSALAQLETEGVVLRERNRGARVREVSLAEAVEITEARAVVEGLCAAKAAARAGADDRARLRVLGTELRAAVDAADVVAYSRTNQQVHRAVQEIARHSTAAQVLERLRIQSVRYHYTVALLPGRPTVGLREHTAIIDAVCAGDPDAAEQAMRAHLLSVVESLQRLDAQQYRW
jgi:DNA-binding GntR family transcriptional regulator